MSFRIVCDNCDRTLCNFQFTENGDIVVYCKSCGKAVLIYKDNPDKEGRTFI